MDILLLGFNGKVKNNVAALLSKRSFREEERIMKYFYSGPLMECYTFAGLSPSST